MAEREGVVRVGEGGDDGKCLEEMASRRKKGCEVGRGGGREGGADELDNNEDGEVEGREEGGRGGGGGEREGDVNNNVVSHFDLS